YALFRQAYRPGSPASVLVGDEDASVTISYTPTVDARTHNNSYGSGIPVVDLSNASTIDQFVWNHEDMVIVVANGNAGPAQATIASPAVAKNDFSSAASANGRQPMVSIDSNASFSSHGPTADLRFGSLVSTPGQ